MSGEHACIRQRTFCPLHPTIRASFTNLEGGREIYIDVAEFIQVLSLVGIDLFLLLVIFHHFVKCLFNVLEERIMT